MAKCIKCGTETKLYDRGVAICTSCSDALDAERKLPVTASSGQDQAKASKIKMRKGLADQHGQGSMFQRRCRPGCGRVIPEFRKQSVVFEQLADLMKIGAEPVTADMFKHPDGSYLPESARKTR